jgi:branched-chain amino acid transport system substrate-binding protein
VTGRAAAVALVALALAASAGAALAEDPGVSSTSVLLGGTVPLTGEAAAFGTVGPGAKAYFDYVNAKGGVNGRRIEYRYYDDAYNPAQTVQLTRRLVEQDKVFAIFNSIGTANNLAVREYLNAQKVPQLYAADGSQSIGRSFARYPWTMGFLQSYRGEGQRDESDSRSASCHFVTGVRRPGSFRTAVPTRARALAAIGRSR